MHCYITALIPEAWIWGRASFKCRCAILDIADGDYDDSCVMLQLVPLHHTATTVITRVPSTVLIATHTSQGGRSPSKSFPFERYNNSIRAGKKKSRVNHAPTLYNPHVLAGNIVRPLGEVSPIVLFDAAISNVVVFRPEGARAIIELELSRIYEDIL